MRSTSRLSPHRSAVGSVGANIAVPTVAEATPPAKPELPVERVVRLAKELSKALDDLNVDIFTADYHGGKEVAVWIAEVWPSKVRSALSLEQRDVPRVTTSVCP